MIFFQPIYACLRDASTCLVASLQGFIFEFGSFNSFGQDTAAYHFTEVPIFVAMGAIGGLFGVLYNSLNLRISSFRVCPAWMISPACFVNVMRLLNR
jgi:H+/Cl- antiporter ClcA